MKVIEIFNSVDGEVNYYGQGTPATFVRFAGCNLRCSYCDTRESWEQDHAVQMTPNEIAEKIKEIGCPKVTLTGGEPLLQSDLQDLIRELKNYCQITIETNGTISLEVLGKCRSCVDVIMDWKRQDPPKYENYSQLHFGEYLKIIVDDSTMILSGELFKIISEVRRSSNVRIAVSPVAPITAGTLLKYLQEKRLWDVQLNIQLHKYINVR